MNKIAKLITAKPTTIVAVTVIITSAFLCAPFPAKAQWNPQPFSPAGQQIAPFGYGQVLQSFVTSTGRTGTAICQATSPAFKCLSVSGGAACSSVAAAGALVSCNAATQPPVDESRFTPPNCNGHATGDGGVSGLINSNEWCLTANYMPARTADTIYQYDDYVRLGVNRRFGGAIAELYGVDKTDRILQDMGGAIQLSLWAFTAIYAPTALARAYFAISSTNTQAWKTSFNSTPFATESACSAATGLSCDLGVVGPNYLRGPAPPFPCADNGKGAGAPFNPIQAVSPGCDWGFPQATVDSVTSSAPGQIAVFKTNPYNFTWSDAMEGVTWRQTSQIQGPAAVVTYQMNSTLSLQDTDYQEIPAIFLRGGLGQIIFYYRGTKPYGDVAGPVSTLNITNTGLGDLRLPGRVGPFSRPPTDTMGEDWVSSCDASGKTCITLATFSSIAQEIIAAYGPTSSYFGIHGYFSMTNNMNKTTTLFMFPYRFDDIVQGRSIRSWIYSFHSNPLYKR